DRQGVLTQEIGGDSLVDICHDRTRSVVGLAEPGQPLVRVDTDKEQVGKLVEPDRFKTGYLHDASLTIRTMRGYRSDRRPFATNVLLPIRGRHRIGSGNHDSRVSVRTSSNVTSLAARRLSASWATRFRLRSISAPNRVIPRVRCPAISREAASASRRWMASTIRSWYARPLSDTSSSVRLRKSSSTM